MNALKLIKFECRAHMKNLTFLILLALLAVFGLTQLREVFHMPVKDESDIQILNQCGERDYLFVPNTDAVLRENSAHFLEKNISNGVIPQDKASLFVPVLDMLRDEQNTYDDVIRFFQKDEYLLSWLMSSKAQFGERLGSVEEVNDNLQDNLGKNGYSPVLFSQYVTYMQIMVAFLIFPIFVFLLLRDYKHSMYELIYAQPLSSSRYLLSRFWGAIVPLSFFLYLFGLFLNIISYWRFIIAGFSVGYTPFITYFVVYLLPTIFFFSSLLTILMLLMKRVVAVFPLYAIYILLNATPAVFNIDSNFIRMLNPVIRLDREPLGTMIVLINRIFYVVLGIFFLIASCHIYEKMRQNFRKVISI